MGYIIMKLVHLTPTKLRTQLTTTLWCKRLKARNDTLPNDRLKIRI